MSTTTQVEIMEFRKLQENTQTPGPKCNRCFYDIIWDKPTSEQLYGIGKNRPFEMNKGTGHTCPIDSQNNYVTRQGYTKDMGSGKVIWIGSPQTTTASSSPLPQGQKQFGTTSGMTSEIAAEIGGLTNSIKQLTTAYEQVAMKQNDEIAKLRTIVDEYIRHNPLESAFLELTKRMLAYLPEAELQPTSADKLKGE